jgi:CspA family cold shock protein
MTTALQAPLPEELRAMNDREEGTIKWFSQAKGYGFIRRQDGRPDAFVHFNDFRSREDGYWAKEGDAVGFNVQQTDKGPRAVDVQLL